MKIKKIYDCECNSPEIKEKHLKGCTLNQIIRCHGDEPLENLLKHLILDDEDKSK